MVKKISLLSIALLACSVIATQNATNAKEQMQKETEKNILLMEQLYQSITKDYDQKKLATLENNIKKEITDYIKNCITNKENITNTKSMENTTKKLLKYLNSVTKTDEAYAAASMIFMVQWSKIISEKALQLENSQETDNLQQKVDNLQKATNEVKTLVEKIFLEPMTKRLEEIETKK
ncbi:hypothetical protein ACFLYU_02590 [Candidatus Dependentiae bacterium]